jgi:hypothetical protein
VTIEERLDKLEGEIVEIQEAIRDYLRFVDMDRKERKDTVRSFQDFRKATTLRDKLFLCFRIKPKI